MSEQTKQDVKNDIFQETAHFTIKWIANNRNTFLMYVGSAVAIIIFGIFVVSRLTSIKSRAEDKLSMAQGALYQGQADQGIKLLDELISQYPSTSAAVKGRLSKAEFLYDQQKYDEAIAVISQSADSAKPETLRPLMKALIGNAYENAGKMDEAIGAYNSFIGSYAEHFMAPKVYESLARVYEIKNSLPDAKNIYERIVTLYPTTPWAQRAQERISVISQNAIPQNR